MNANIRSAIIGGLAGTFVVAAAFAPRLIDPDRPSAVRFEQSATDTGIDTSTTTAPDEPTTTTTVPSTTTSTLATTTTRPLSVEERLSRIEATTTTTAPLPATPPRYVNCGQGSAPPDGVGWLVIGCVVNPIMAPSDTFKPLPENLFPNFRVRARFDTDNGPREVVVPAPVNCGTFNVSIDAADHPVFDDVVALEWDAGSMANQRP